MCNKLTFTVRDIRGQGIERSLLYLERAVKLDRSGIRNLAAVLVLGELRNAVAHAQGYLDDLKNAEELKKRIAKPIARFDMEGKSEIQIPLPSLVSLKSGLAGDRLCIKNELVMIAAETIRDFLLQVLIKATFVTNNANHGAKIRIRLSRLP